jgi:hypothetical protein
MIVGLDVSTSCVGVCILCDDGSLKSIHHIDLRKEKNFYKKVKMVLEFLLDGEPSLRSCSGFKFFVEAPLLVFKMKASMASTIALLQRFNAAVCYAIYSTWNMEPKHISVISARKAVGITLPKKKKKAEIKPIVFEYVKSLGVVPESSWAYKKTGRPKDWVYDRCDAFVVARAAYLLPE